SFYVFPILNLPRIPTVDDPNTSPGSTPPPQFRRIEPLSRHIFQNLCKVEIHSGHDRLSFRVAKSAVKLQHFGTVFRQHQANIQKSLVRDRLTREPPQRGLDDG